MITQCCVCRNVLAEDEWVSPTPDFPMGESVSHGLCPGCAKEVSASVDAYFDQAEGSSGPSQSMAT